MFSCDFTLQTNKTQSQQKASSGYLGALLIRLFLKVLTYNFPSFSKGGNASLSHQDSCFIPEQDQHPSAESGGDGSRGGQANLGVLRSRILCRDWIGINECCIFRAAHNHLFCFQKEQ